ncbi:MAG: class I SAM-dependent methyltransferase [Caldilineaceae bacterium]
MRKPRGDHQALEPTSQLVLRAVDARVAGDLLIINYPADGFLATLKARHSAIQPVGFTHDYRAHRHACAAYTTAGYARTELHFGPLYSAPARYPAVLLFLPKSQLLTKLMLTMAANHLTPAGHLLLVGHNKAGIQSSRSLAEEVIGPTAKVDAARHSVLFQSTQQAEVAPLQLAAWETIYPLQVGATSLQIVTLPGVFSHGRLDAGTQMLLETLTEPLHGHVLDLGCGAGVIGAMIKQRWPACVVDMVDVDALALAATRRTLAVNGLATHPGPYATGGVFPSDVFSDVAGAYDWIISNPPFHAGVQIDYQAVTTFLQQAADYLKPGGRLRIVANRFLKYQPLIEAHIGGCQVIAENRQYGVYEALLGRAGGTTR